MKHFVGIDFGTSNTCISYLDKGKVKVLKYNNMSVIPSVISFNKKIKCGINIDTSNILREFKTKMFEEDFKYNEMNINQILIIFFSFLKNVIEVKLGKSDVIELIASVPSNFNDTQRKIIKSSFKSAGFKINRLINEPTAAALSFGLENTIDDELILVIDIGGGTTDFSVLEIDEGFFEVIDSYGLNDIGGFNINKLIDRYIRKKIKKKYTHQTIELIKRRINVLGKYNDDNLTIDDRTFDRIILDIIIKYEEMFNLIKSKHNIKKVIMVGGGSNMKFIKELIIRGFGNIIIPNPDLNYCVSKGCCYYLATLNNILDTSQDITLVDVNPLSLGVELTNGNFSIIIPKNTPLPAKMTQRYSIDDSSLEIINIKIYQGERKIAKDNMMVGMIEYVIDSKTINPVISITFKLTTENIIIVSITNESNNSKIDYTLENKINYDFVDEHMAQSLENYHEDLKSFKLNEKRYLATIMIESKINIINNNISIERERKETMLKENFNILQNIKILELDDLDKIIETNHIIKENQGNVNETEIDQEIKDEMIKNRKIKLQEIMNTILLNNDLEEDENMFVDNIKEALEINNITSIELDNLINNYDFIKRKNYQEEFSYLIKYLKDNIIDFDLSDEKKDSIIQFLEKSIIEVSENKEYKKYIKKINNYCKIIYDE